MHDLYRVVVPSILIGALMVLVDIYSYALGLSDVVGASPRSVTRVAAILFRYGIILRWAAAPTGPGVHVSDG